MFTIEIYQNIMCIVFYAIQGLIKRARHAVNSEFMTNDINI